MKFSTDELMPFFEVRTGMSKHLDDVQAGKEIVITRHGKPEGALVSAAQLYRYRELERVITELTALLKSTRSILMVKKFKEPVTHQIVRRPPSIGSMYWFRC